MDIKNILEYQNAVIKLEKVKEDYQNDDFFKKVRALQINKKVLEGELDNLKGKAGAYEKALETIKNDLESLLSEIAYLADENAEDLDVETIDKNLEYLKNYENQVEDLGKQNKSTWTEYVNVNRTTSEKKDLLDKIIENYEPLKPQVASFNAGFKKRIDDATNELKNIENKLSLEELTIYKEALDARVKTNKSMKGSQVAQVLYKTPNGCCACGIELDPQEQEKLLKNKYVKCQSCGKIVYIE